MSVYTTLGQVLPSTLTMGPDRVNSSPQHTRQKQTSDMLTHIFWVEQESRPKRYPHHLNYPL